MKSSRKRSGKRTSGKKKTGNRSADNATATPSEAQGAHEAEKDLKLDDNNVLSLESFPRFDHRQSGSLRKISDYLKRIISRSFKHSRICAVDLPSMNRLCGFFKCSQGELLNVLLLLKGQELDYKIYALDKPISFWRNTAQDKRRKTS